MSKYTPSPPYTEEEFADMVQCYIDSGKNIELTQMYYVNRYPSRRRPKPYTLEKVVQKYLKTLDSNITAQPHVEVTKSASIKDDRILKYFINNSHATIKKAASIFNVQTYYIDHLLEDRKADMETMRKDYEILREEHSLNDHIRRNRKSNKSLNNSKQDQGDSEEKLHIKVEIDRSDSENNEHDVFICPMEAPHDAIASKTSESEKSYKTIRSETIKKEADDDVICCETEITKKRKRKYKKRGGNKKQKTSERVQKNEDPPILETPHMHNPVVYTTRLEEMIILHKNLKHLNSARVINEILLESKPKYTVRRSNIKVRRTMSFKLLKNILRKFDKIEAHIDLTQKVHTNNDDDDEPIITEVINTTKCYTFNAKEDVVLDINIKYDITIVINNLFSNTNDIYVTDSKGNIIEYYCNKASDYMKHINNFKCRLTFDMCCWHKRQHRVESIWPRHEYPFSRFLTTTHKCPPDRCICCCKVKKRAPTPEVVLVTPCDTHIFTDSRSILSNFTDTDTEPDEHNRSLILSALIYNKPEVNKTDNFCSKPKNITSKRFLFSQFFKCNFIHKVKNVFFETGNNQEIVRFHTDFHLRDRARCIRCPDLTSLPGKPHSKLVVCCKLKRDSYLYKEYKACNISSNTLRFLKKTLFPLVCETCKVTSPETNKSASLDVLPRIEHSRISVKPTLLKIGYKAQTPSFFNNQKYIRVKDLARQIPHCSNVMHETETAATNVDTPTMMSVAVQTPTLTSTVKINVRCEQIPELVFETSDVDIQVATAIVTKFKQMSFTVKEDGKVIASLNSSIQTTSTEEFQVFAQILQHIQNYLKLVPLSSGSPVNLVVKIDNDKQSGCQTYENVNQSIDVASNSGDARNEVLPFKDDLIQNPSKQVTYINNDFHKRIENALDVCDYDEQISTNLLKNIRNTSNQFSSSASGLAHNLNNVNKREVIILTNQLEEFDSFAKIISYSKNCYAESFKSYLKAKHDAEDEDMSVPKITGVFSLQSSSNKTANILNILDTEASIPSTSNNDNVKNFSNLNALLPPAGPPMCQQATGIMYDPITKLAQIVNLNPNVFGSKLAMPDAYSSSMNENVVLVKPIGMGESDSGLAVLTPINMAMIQPVPYQSSQLKPILPDVINDIPVNNYVMDETNHTVVKDELGNEVVILDSD